MNRDMNLREQFEKETGMSISRKNVFGSVWESDIEYYIKWLEKKLQPQLKTEEEWFKELSEEAGKWLDKLQYQMINGEIARYHIPTEMALFTIEVNKQLIFQLEQKNL